MISKKSIAPSLPQIDKIMPIDQTTNLDDLARRIGLRKWALLLFVLSGFVVGLGFSFLKEPTYRSTALLEVRELNDNVLNTRDVDPNASLPGGSVEPYLESQIRILQSETLVNSVIDRLHLDDAQSPVFKRGPLSFIGGTTSARRDRDKLIQWVQKRLSAQIPGPTRLIEISFESPDPPLSAAVVNTLVDAYIERSIKLRSQSADRTKAWLDAQILELKTRLELSDQVMQKHAVDNGLLFTSDKNNIEEARLLELQAELSKAQETRAAEQARYERIGKASIESLPEVVNDETLRSEQAKLTDLRRQDAELRPILGPGHYRMQQIRSQISEAEGSIEHKRTVILEEIKNQFGSASRREQLLRASYELQKRIVAAQAQKAIGYNVLKREVDTNRQIYESMLQKSREVSIAAAMRVSNMSVVDAAKASPERYRPNRELFAIVGSASGMFLGLAFVLFPRANRPITYHIDEGMGKLFYRPEWHFLPPVEGGIIPPELMTFAQSDHRFAEVARSALASILLRCQPGRRPHVFVIASRRQGDGRTTVAANLAVALAQARSRTLLIDGDLRKGRFHELFSTSNDIGLTTILSAKCSFENYSAESIAVPTDVANLFLLSCGPSSVGDANLLFGERLPQLFSFLRTRFENIVIDSPPASMFADVRLLAANSDGVVLVVCPDSEEAEFSTMLESFVLDNIPVLGTIVNAGFSTNPTVHNQAPGLISDRKGSVFTLETQSDLRGHESY